MNAKSRSYRSRFDWAVDVNMLENPLVPRQSENASWLLDQRYLLDRRDGDIGSVRKERDFEEFARRISRVIASTETLYSTEDDIEWIRTLEKNLFSDILNRRFLFNSPCLFGSGAGMTVLPAYSDLIYRSPDLMSYHDYVVVREGKTESQQLFACFVISVEDSIEGIFGSVKDAAVISKYGGGVGANFGNLRESGSDIKGGTGGKASGPVSFMETWNTMGSVVVQGGRRRAALMGMIYDDHPDIEGFMDAKVEDGKLPYFNISVSISDRLLEAAKKGEDFDLISRADGSVVRKVKASDLWDKLCKNAWRRGDPGVFFGDRANVDNILKLDTKWRIESTNPCVTGDTWIMTDVGPKQARDLVGSPATLLVDGVAHGSEGFFSTGVKPVFELKTKEGHSLKLTADHKVRKIAKKTRDSMDFQWVPASELSEGDLLTLNDHRKFAGWSGKYSETEGYLMGLLLGDGTIKDDKAVLSVWIPEKAGNDDISGQHNVMDKAFSCALEMKHRSDFSGWSPVSGRSEYRLSTAAIKQLALDLGMSVGRKEITPDLEGDTSSSFYCGFLRGLFDSDGSVQGGQIKGVSVRLAQSDLAVLQAVQRMLGRLGIVGKIYARRKAGLKVMPDGKGGERLYPFRDQYELIISNENLSLFQIVVGFEDGDKSLRLENALNSYGRRQNRERFIAHFESLVPCGEEEVFDVQVAGVNAFDANGLYVHNCGEQPLPNYTSCNLGSVNLEPFVSTEARGSRAFDMEAFVDQVYRSVYYLDLVIDATSYPLEQIAKRTESIRPVGLGLMGLADSAITLDMVYGSDQFNRFCRSLAQNMSVGALAATVELTELGKDPFPEHHLVSRLMEEFRIKAGLSSFSNGWLEELDEKGFNEVVERMGRSDIIPFTLVNTLEGLLGATAVHWGDGLGLAKKVLSALISGRMRNSRRLSVAPTGSISMLFDSSPGIEPNFAWTWSRKVMSAKGDGGYETREYFHPMVPSELKEELRSTGKLEDPRFVTAYDIGTEAHVNVTGIFASVVDSGISKTVNLPPEATVEDVKKVYEECYRLGCKGITIYRDGSRSEQPIEAKKPESQKASNRPMSSQVKARPGIVMLGKTIKDTTPWGSLYVTLNYDEKEPFEVFASLGKSGSEMKSMTEALSRVISIGLRSGGKLEDFINTLRGISGKEYWLFDCDDQTVVRSIPDGVALLMEKLSGVKGERPTEVPRCPECDSPMEMVGGCEYCFSCGYSPCK